MEIFERTKKFPKGETDSMVDQMRRSSRLVCVNIAQAWRRRRPTDYLQSKLSEAEETRVWIEFAYRCQYLDARDAKALDEQYDQLLGQLVQMCSNADDWVLRT